MKRGPFLPALFSIIMLVCVLFVIWYLPSVSQRRFLIEDVRKSLETSQGRERKQQHEYDETVSALPEVQAELDQLIPQMESAKEEVKTFKEKRKQLRNEKKSLETDLSSVGNEEASYHD